MPKIKQKNYGISTHDRLTKRVKRLLIEFSINEDFVKWCEILQEIVDCTSKGQAYRRKILAGYTSNLTTSEQVLTEVCSELLAEYSQLDQLSVFKIAT